MKDVFYAIGILSTFIIASWNAYGNYKNTKKTLYINTVSADRIKVIGEIRDSVSSLCIALDSWMFGMDDGKEKALSALYPVLLLLDDEVPSHKNMSNHLEIVRRFIGSTDNPKKHEEEFDKLMIGLITKTKEIVQSEKKSIENIVSF